MKTKEERQQRRREALAKFREIVKRRARHALRRFDEDDKETAQALATGLLLAIRDGIDPEEEEALGELFDAFKEARENTP